MMDSSGLEAEKEAQEKGAQRKNFEAFILIYVTGVPGTYNS